MRTYLDSEVTTQDPVLQGLLVGRAGIEPAALGLKVSPLRSAINTRKPQAAGLTRSARSAESGSGTDRSHASEGRGNFLKPSGLRLSLQPEQPGAVPPEEVLLCLGR